MSRHEIDPELPWGVWLRVEPGDPTAFVDEEGRRWDSLRAAFWCGRLGMPAAGGRDPSPEMLELVHAVLARMVRRPFDGQGDLHEFFEGSRRFRSLFHDWLHANGLITSASEFDMLVTDEGRAALLMLLATRTGKVRTLRPSGATVDQLSELGLGPEDREERFARLEQAATKWDAAFLRRTEAGRPSVILSKRGKGMVPVHLTVWRLGFDSAELRDNFYDWLCFRLDRWTDWGELASELGSKELTHRLLEAMASSLPEAPG